MVMTEDAPASNSVCCTIFRWALSLWQHVKKMRNKQHVRPNQDTTFQNLCNTIATSFLTSSKTLSFISTANIEDPYEVICKWYTLENHRDVDINILVVTPHLHYVVLETLKESVAFQETDIPWTIQQ